MYINWQARPDYAGIKRLAILEETGQWQDSELKKYTIPCNKTVLFYLTQPTPF